MKKLVLLMVLLPGFCLALTTNEQVTLLKDVVSQEAGDYFNASVSFTQHGSGGYEALAFVADFSPPGESFELHIGVNENFDSIKPVLTKGTLVNGFAVTYNTASETEPPGDYYLAAFDCPVAKGEHPVYAVFFKASPQFSGVVGVWEVLTTACLGFQEALVEPSPSLVPSPSPLPSPSPSPLPSLVPSPSPVAPSPSPSPSPTVAPTPTQDNSLLYAGVAVVALALVVGWYFGRKGKKK